MKKVTLLCVGRLKEKYLTAGIEEYVKRLSRFCSLEIAELADESGCDAVRRESDAILKRLKGYTVLFGIDGRLVTSPELSRLMERAYLSAPEITFVIGGSEGVDARVKDVADEIVSFGRVTYPHQLMRLIACEQIYRAFNIAAGTPYHK